MDFIDELKNFSKRVESLKERVTTEEATKTSIIMPFFQLLGYDVFNPDEFLPEYIADVGIKKGEKVDYAIMREGEPLILVEAKPCSKNDLKKFGTQLFRYFGTTKAKFAILTNGIFYMFYTDLDEQNIMDSKPFFEFNILDIKENKVNELKKFKKENLDVSKILSSAAELKYSNEIKLLMNKILEEPTDGFINYVLGEIYSGKRTQNAKDRFKLIIKKSLNQFVNELMNDRIKSAIEKQDEPSQDINNKEDNPPVEVEEKKSQIVTTMEELESYFIIKSILRDDIDSEKITYKDTLSYFGILLENNSWKWICRIYLKENSKYVIIPDENKNEIRYDIEKIEDIHNLKEQLIESMKRYL